jgi:hypothetical protein
VGRRESLPGGVGYEPGGVVHVGCGRAVGCCAGWWTWPGVSDRVTAPCREPEGRGDVGVTPVHVVGLEEQRSYRFPNEVCCFFPPTIIYPPHVFLHADTNQRSPCDHLRAVSVAGYPVRGAGVWPSLSGL